MIFSHTNIHLHFLAAVLFIPFFSTALSGQNTFQQYITISDSIFLSRNIAETTDGNIIVSGVLEYRRPNNQSPLHFGTLTKLNQAGGVLWSLEVIPGSSLTSYVTDVQSTPDGGAVALVFLTESYRMHIVKVDGNGNFEWAKKATANGYVWYSTLQQISGGYLVAAQEFTAGNALVCKIDLSGNVVWSHTFAKCRFAANRATEDEDGNIYIPGGVSMSQAFQIADPLLVKFDATGNLLWSKTYTDQFTSVSPHPSFLHLRRVLPLGDGLLLMSNNFTSADMVFTKIDHDGNALLQKRFKNAASPTSFYPLLNACVVGSDEVVVGTFDSWMENRPTLFSLSASLEMRWMKSYGIDGIQLYNFNDMERLREGKGYLFCGQVYDQGPQQICIVKTDSTGEFSGRCCARTEQVFQGTGHPVTVTDIQLEEVPSTMFADANLNTELVTAQKFILCDAPASASVIAASDTLICPGNCLEVSMLNPEPGSDYEWKFPGAIVDTSTLINPGKVCYTDQGRYNMMLYEEGCLVDSAAIQVDGRPEMFPNAFSPNGDQVNDIFRPIGMCPVEEFHLKIYNRWGKQIFESNEINEGWNGEINGTPAPVDVYIYQVQYFTYINGVRTLLRNEKKEVTLVR